MRIVNWSTFSYDPKISMHSVAHPGSCTIFIHSCSTEARLGPPPMGNEPNSEGLRGEGNFRDTDDYTVDGGLPIMLHPSHWSPSVPCLSDAIENMNDSWPSPLVPCLSDAIGYMNDSLPMGISIYPYPRGLDIYSGATVEAANDFSEEDLLNTSQPVPWWLGSGPIEDTDESTGSHLGGISDTDHYTDHRVSPSAGDGHNQHNASRNNDSQVAGDDHSDADGDVSTTLGVIVDFDDSGITKSD